MVNIRPICAAAVSVENFIMKPLCVVPVHAMKAYGGIDV
jgi:hypothetical protein